MESHHTLALYARVIEKCVLIFHLLRIGHVIWHMRNEYFGIYARPDAIFKNNLIYVHQGWLRSSAVERRSLAGKLSLSCARSVVDG